MKKRINPDLSCEWVIDLDSFLPSESEGSAAIVMILCKESTNYIKFNLYCGTISRGFKMFAIKDEIFIC